MTSSAGHRGEGATLVASGRARAFAALQHRGFTTLLVCSAAAMMADSVEHVISYWVMFQKFQSPALGGFAVIAHWLPFLVFSVPAGALGDRFGPRRLIQLGMLVFMGVSLTWAWLFVTNTIQLWHAAVLLVCHGLAGVLWAPLTQLLLEGVAILAEVFCLLIVLK